MPRLWLSTIQQDLKKKNLLRNPQCGKANKIPALANVNVKMKP